MVPSNASLLDAEQLLVDDYITAAQKGAFSAYFIATIFVGSLGNGAIVFTIWRNEKLHSAAYALLANLAVADFLVCAVLIPLHTAMFVHGVIPGRHHPWCRAESFLITVTEGASLLSVAAVALNRYATICNHGWRRWLTMRFVAGVMVAIWLYSFAAAITPILLDVLNVEPLGLQASLTCFVSDRVLYTLYALLMFAPFTATLFSYLKIYLFLREQRKRVVPSVTVNVVHQPTRRPKRKRSDDSRVLQSIVAVTCMYSACVSLHLIFRFILLFLVDDAYHSGIHIGSWCVILISNWTSVIIYLLWNPTFRHALLVALGFAKQALLIEDRSNNARMTEILSHSAERRFTGSHVTADHTALET